jgi:hypothetical protein
MAQSVYRLYYHGPDDQGLESLQVKEIYLFSCTSKPTVRPSQPPTEWETKFFPGGKAAGE